GHCIEGHRERADQFTIDFDPWFLGGIGFDVATSHQRRPALVRLSSLARSQRAKIRKIVCKRRQNINFEPGFIKLRIWSHTQVAAVALAVSDQRKHTVVPFTIDLNRKDFGIPGEQVPESGQPIGELTRPTLEPMVDAARNRGVETYAGHHNEIAPPVTGSEAARTARV